ncbi:MAG: hypothetical protein WBA10_13090 [Elainellaceae cyanobacterium]
MIPTSQPTPPLNPNAQTYRDQLHPWCIVRLLPKAQRITVARFRKRNDADAHMRTLRRLIPDATFIIIFDPPPVAGSGLNSPTVPETHQAVTNTPPQKTPQAD